MSSHSFSFTRLQTFEQCPTRYRFTYLEGLPVPDESIESFLGSRLHAALEWLYRERRRGRNILFDDLLKEYRNLWSDAWHDRVRIADFSMQTDDYYQLGQRCLAGFFRRYAPFDEPVEGMEHTLTFDLEGDGAYPMTAILDRLDSHAPGWWSIHDYKATRRMLTLNQAEKDLQMRIYYLALTLTPTPVERVDVVWHFLRHGRDVRLERVQWNPKRIATMLRKRIDRVREAEAHPDSLEPKESVLCNWCYFWSCCPAKQGQTHPTRLAV